MNFKVRGITNGLKDKEKSQRISNQNRIDHFTVVYSVTWPLNGCEAAGDLVLIKTSLLVITCWHLNGKAERSV